MITLNLDLEAHAKAYLCAAHAYLSHIPECNGKTLHEAILLDTDRDDPESAALQQVRNNILVWEPIDGVCDERMDSFEYLDEIITQQAVRILQFASQSAHALHRDAKETCDHERAFWNKHEQDSFHHEPSWLAELESSVKNWENSFTA